MEDTTLSQSEIDELMSAVEQPAQSEKSSSKSVPPEEKAAKDPRKIQHDTSWLGSDAGSQEKFFRSRLGALDTIHERFSRLLRMTLSNTLKKMVSVTYTHTEFTRFNDYINSLPVPTSFNVVTMLNPTGSMIFVVGSKLTYSMIDAYYGGIRGAAVEKTHREEFTEIEKAMLNKVSNLAVRDMEEAWKLNYPVGLRYLRTESNSHFLGGVIQASETVAIANFEVEFDQASGQFIVILQTRALDSIAKYLSISVTGEFNSDQQHWEHHWIKEISDMELDVSAVLGTTTLTLHQLEKLKIGDVLRLDHDPAAPLPFYVQGLCKGEGMMGSFRGSQALRLTDVDFESPY